MIISVFYVDIINYPCSNPDARLYLKKYAHGFVVLCFVVVMQSFIMNSHEVFIHIHQGCFAGTGAIVRLPQCQWSKPDGYGKISQCITTTKHSKAKTVCIFLGIYCRLTTVNRCLLLVSRNIHADFVCLKDWFYRYLSKSIHWHPDNHMIDWLTWVPDFSYW